MRLNPTALPLFAILGLAQLAPAHGGQYRGPTNPPGGRAAVPTPGGRTGPTTGGVVAPGTPASAIPDATRWQVWWELNKDAYLRAPELARNPRLRVGDRKGLPKKIKLDVILPALKRALDATSNKHITTACMMALAKIGLDHPSFEILEEFQKRLKRGNQEIREVAALAMGVSRRVEAIPLLASLIEDTKKGQRAVGRDSVSNRTRAFAAYGLGLIARAHDDAKVKERALEVLSRVLADDKIRSRDLLIAVLNGFRLLDLRVETEASHRRLLWSALESLLAYQNKRLSKTRQMVQAHVPTAIARLVGRGAGSDQERMKKLYAALFADRQKRHATLYQSATIAMGHLLLANESRPTEATYDKSLQRHLKSTRDQLTSNFGLIAMGQIGGKTNIDRLIRELRKGKRIRQGWAALALGLAAFHAPLPKKTKGTQARKVTVREQVGAELYRALLAATNRDVRAAAALGLGLANHQKAAPTLRKLLKKYKNIEEFAGYIALGLAMMEDKPAGDMIQAMMTSSRNKPLLMVQSSLALARLRHPNTSLALRDILRSGSSFKTMTLASAANAMGYHPDPNNVAPLVQILGGRSNDKVVRAFAAVALGSMAEDGALSWSSWIAMNMNYSATVETISNGSAGILDIL